MTSNFDLLFQDVNSVIVRCPHPTGATDDEHFHEPGAGRIPAEIATELVDERIVDHRGLELVGSV